MKKVFVIILNWNGWKMTLDCLKSLEKTKCDGFELELVVVDNGSTDESIEKIKNQISIRQLADKTTTQNPKLIENKENLGFAKGNNVGIRYSLDNGADYICLLNNDTRVDPDFLSELIKTGESDEKIGLVGGKIYFEKGYEFHKDKYKDSEKGKVIWYAGGLINWKNVYTTHRGVDEVDRGQYETAIETDYVNGCLALIKKEVFEKIGSFDGKYFLYFEDTDLSVRAKKSGFKLIYCPKAKIWHLNSGSSGSGSGLHDYFTTRNRMIFGMKYASFKSKIALIRESLKLMFSGRIWQKRGIKDYYLSKFGKGSWNG